MDYWNAGILESEGIVRQIRFHFSIILFSSIQSPNVPVISFQFRCSNFGFLPERIGKLCKECPNGISGLRKWKYQVLLATLLVAAVLESLVADLTERTRVLAIVLLVGVNLGVFFVIFEQLWERCLGFFLLALVLASGIVHQTLSNYAQIAAIANHGFGVMFFGFAVAVILKRIFQQKTIRADAVIGALCGYLLAAIAWANAYELIYLLRPGSFRVADVIAAHLGDWYSQRFLFIYFSVTTLTSLGYSDITPIGPLALSLSWLEVVFGQFYIAVVVAQLVGLKLAESISRGSSDSN